MKIKFIGSACVELEYTNGRENMIKSFIIILVTSTFSLASDYPFDWAPGALDPDCTVEKVCVPGYTRTVRPYVTYTNRLKAKQIKEHPEIDCSKGAELDHVIPLELCGDPTNIKNLSIEPYFPIPGAHEKDWVEDALHKQVCNNQMSLEEAQYRIVHSWVNYYNTYHE